MAPPKNEIIPPAPRKSLLEWIETDDGDTTEFAPPPCSQQAAALHAQIVRGLQGAGGREHETLSAPRGLVLPPLG